MLEQSRFMRTNVVNCASRPITERGCTMHSRGHVIAKFIKVRYFSIILLINLTLSPNYKCFRHHKTWLLSGQETINDHSSHIKVPYASKAFSKPAIQRSGQTTKDLLFLFAVFHFLKLKYS